MRKLILIFIIPFSVLNSGVYGSVSGRISDSITQTGISNAYINVIESGKKAISDSDGKYSVFGLPLKKYKVSVTTPGYISQTKEVEVQDSPITILDFSLEKTGKNSEIASNFSTNFGSVSGFIRSVNTGADIIGATVLVIETNAEVKSDFMARYLINDLSPGKYRIKVTAPGYKEQMKIVEVLSGQSVPMNFFLEETGRDNSQVGSLAEAAKQRPDNTYILKNNNDLRLENSYRLPNAFNVFPSVFITDRGNQNLYPEMYYRGTSRLNVNINGIPMNDCFGDYHLLQNQPDILAFTSAAVIQPGGGTLFNDDYPSTGSISIITKRPNPKPGVGISQFFGAGNSFTTAVAGSTGRLGAFSLETGFVTNSTEGLIEKLWNSSMSYYFAADYDNGGAHRFEFTFLGTYKRHANRDDVNYLWYWDLNFAKEQGMALTQDVTPLEFGINHNPNWGETNFQSKEYYWSKSNNPKYSDFLNSTVTYSHTPMGSFNWNWKFSENLNLNNNFYFLANNDGFSTFAGNNPLITDVSSIVDFNMIYRRNTDTTRVNPKYPQSGKEADTYLQNIASNRLKYGWLGILKNKFSENFKVSLLINYTNENTKSYREVRNLIGGDYILDIKERQGRTEFQRYLGDKFGFYNEDIINKLGAGASADMQFGDLSVNALAQASVNNYTRKDLLNSTNSDIEKTGMISTRFAVSANYKVIDDIRLFANASNHITPPRFDALFGYNHKIYDSIDNENSINLELGAAYNISYFRTVLNFYYNHIKGYSFTDLFSTFSQMQKITYLNLEKEGSGIELFLFYKPNDLLELMLSGSISKTIWLGKGSGRVSDLLNIDFLESNSKFDINGILAGGAPRKSFSFSGTVFPYQKSYINFKLNFYAENYSQILPWSYPDVPETKYRPWMIPDYFMLEAHAAFDIPIIEFLDVSLFANVYNILNTKYVALSYEGNKHSGQWTNITFDNLVIFGLPLSWDVGVRIGL
jgi:iron complex outermembrane recepter protein